LDYALLLKLIIDIVWNFLGFSVYVKNKDFYVHRLQQLPVWNLAMDVAVNIFDLTESLPRKEDYGLTSQIRRSALSISDNIAEGFGRQSSPDKVKFYYYSRGSAYESKNQLLYGNKVGYFKLEEVDELINILSQIIESLNRLIKTITMNNLPNK
jgi:four helix bundle protein